MISQEIRSRFLSFFEKRAHAILPSASLFTEETGDATNATLFNTAGMQPLIPYLMGKDHPRGKRLASSQKCVRTVDIDEVGDNTHVSFFEMLGNWSLGDYFKKESLTWSWEFLTDTEEGLGLDPERLYVTVFSGGEIDGISLDRDDESTRIWTDIFNDAGLNPQKRIFFKREDNWWSAGDNSPAGATSEIFYDLSNTHRDGLTQEEFERFEDAQDIIEIWNNVFMEYEKLNGKVVGKLAKHNVDTGAGLERLCAVLQGKRALAETDLFVGLMDIVRTHAENYDERQARIITDHIKTALFMIADGVRTSNTGRGYILRRMIRRSVTLMNRIGFDTLKVGLLIDEIIALYREVYDFSAMRKALTKSIELEIEKYLKTLKRGEQEIHKLQKKNIALTGEVLANLEQTHGLPFEIASTVAARMGVEISDEAESEYRALKKKHQEQSRTASAGSFKGGLTGDSPKIRAFHTATHLMLAGLRKFLGDDVHQKGSNITEERTRFDFTYPEKVSREVLDQVEDYVNRAIEKHARVTMEKMDKSKAQESGVVGSFWEKYPDEVQVYSIDDAEGENYSKELCGGPHVECLDELASFGRFKIKKEESSSAGVRRIKAVFE